VADGTVVTVTEQTHYPFEGLVQMKLQMDKSTRFPLYLRIPVWCSDTKVKVNNESVTTTMSAGQYLKLDREWRNGDQISIEFPMKLKVRTWEKNKNSVSLNYGPLTYSLKIKENYTRLDSKQTAQYDSKWQENSDPSQWPSYEIQPSSVWNFGLSGNLNDLEKTFTITHKPWPKDNFPFTLESVPLEIKTKAKKIPSWTIDQYGLCSELPQSPVSSTEPEEEITLVPMGAALLRISAFPVVK